MNLTILGSGTAAPLLERSNAAYLLDTHNKKFLLDSGAGTIRRLLESRQNLNEIDNIFYSHLHNDHINDLGAIIWANNYGLHRKKELHLYGPVGLKNYFNILLKQLLKPANLFFKIKIKELKNSSFRIGNLKINTQKIIHSSSSNSIAYRFNIGGKTFVYTGDTEYCKETLRVSKNANFLMTECSHPDKMKMAGHLTPYFAGKLAKEAKVKNLILTHFYPQALKTDIKRYCRKEFSGNIILAEDGMKVNI